MRKTMLVTLLITMMVLVTGIVGAQEYQQSPLLDERVERGEIPPVAERLPAEPKVFEVAEEIGQYGGTLRMVHSRVTDSSQLRGMSHETLVEVTPFLNRFASAEDLEANIVDSWNISDDGTEFTFHIREGLKWSDGVEVTTEDVRYVMEDYYGNEELTEVYPHWLRVEGEKAELEVIDDYTFKIKFAGPNGLFVQNLQTYAYGYPVLIQPSHYLKQFHIDYTSLEEMKPALEEEGLDDDQWIQLHNDKAAVRSNSLQGVEEEFPVLFPWIIKERPSPGVTILERNPYYWKVDKEGNQLPYVDKIRMELVQDKEMISMKILSGEIDFECGAGGLALSNLPMYKENEDKGNYTTLLLPSSFNTPVFLFPNITHPEAGEYLRDARFRKALSLGMDREEINELIFFGMGEPVQATARPGSIFRVEEFANAYTEYDPEKANQLLDEMGLEERNSDGWRVTPDGKEVKIPIEFFEVNASLVPATEIIVKHWQELGINADFRLIEMNLWVERKASNQNVMAEWHQDPLGPGLPFIWFVPAYFARNFGTNWFQWYNTDGEEGEEPPAEIKKLYDLLYTLRTTVSSEERIEAGKEILRSQAENIWVLGTVGNVPGPTVISNELGNVNEENVDSQWGINVAEQIYFKQ